MMCSVIDRATSPSFQAMIAELPHADRGRFLRMFWRLQVGLKEGLLGKLGFWNALPFMLLKVLCPFFGHPMDDGRRAAAQCIQEYDALPDARGEHRVTHRFLARGGASI